MVFTHTNKGAQNHTAPDGGSKQQEQIQKISFFLFLSY